MRAEGWMCFAGTEIVNSDRTLTYRLRGLLADGRDSVEGCATTLDIYDGDTYVGDTYDDTDLVMPCCVCPAVIDQAWQSPADDPAPWFDATRPESADYLGVFVDRLDILDVHTRTVTGRNAGPLDLKPRIVQVQATMFAATDPAMVYGERWLTEALRGGWCDDLAALELLPACPDTTGDGTRTLFRAGLLAGPTFAPIRSLPEVRLQSVSWQMVAEVPWLHGPPVRVIDALLNPGASLTAEVETGEWTGGATLTVTIQAAHGTLRDVTVTVTPKRSPDDECPYPWPPCARYVLPEVPAGSTVVIDGAARQATLTPGTTRVAGSLLPYLDLGPGLFEWPDVPPCTTVCVHVDATHATIPLGTTVTVDARLREL